MRLPLHTAMDNGRVGLKMIETITSQKAAGHVLLAFEIVALLDYIPTYVRYLDYIGTLCIYMQNY